MTHDSTKRLLLPRGRCTKTARGFRKSSEPPLYRCCAPALAADIKVRSGPWATEWFRGRQIHR